MRTLWQDLRYGARMLLKNPGFTSISPANFLDWKNQTTAFEQISARSSSTFNLSGLETPERVSRRRQRCLQLSEFMASSRTLSRSILVK